MVERLKEQIAAVRSEAPGQTGTAVQDAQATLAGLAQRLDGIVTEQITAAEDALAKKKNRLEKFTVTLFGWTMAGKSTIREALTYGDGGTIGKGAQRTTRDVKEYEWNQLRIVDTPGIGAYKGEGDRRIATSVIDESDVLIFLVSSDSIQETEFRSMRDVRDRNKPILFVLNIKYDLTKAVYRRKFLGGSYSLEAIAGHKERIRQLASGELGIRKPTIIPIYAQAAFLATRPEYASHRPTLHRASHVDDLLEELEDEVCRRGPILRLQTLLDGMIIPLMDLEDSLQEQAKSPASTARLFKSKFDELDT